MNLRRQIIDLHPVNPSIDAFAWPESRNGPWSVAVGIRRKRVLRSKPKRTTTPRWLKELRK